MQHSTRQINKASWRRRFPRLMAALGCYCIHVGLTLLVILGLLCFHAANAFSIVVTVYSLCGWIPLAIWLYPVLVRRMRWI